MHNDHLYVSGAPNPYKPPVVTSANPASPRIGDIRARWKHAPAKVNATVVAVQDKDSFRPYIAGNGCEVSLFSQARVPVQAMFSEARALSSLKLGSLRILGCLVMYAWLVCMFGMVGMAAVFIPGLDKPAGCPTKIISVLITLTLSAMAIGTGWLLYRPLAGLAVLAIGAGIILQCRATRKAPTSHA